VGSTVHFNSVQKSETNGLFVGVLSGTSVNGIDAALVEFTPQPRLVATHSLDYPAEVRTELLALAVPGVDEIDRLGRADVTAGRLFAQAVKDLLAKAGKKPAEIRAIGSHGQTIRHRPHMRPAFTLQIGDPNVIAAETGIAVAADFRRKDMALGGQGAPLVPAFHAAVFRLPGRERVVVNIGGIANITILSGDSGTVRGFDTGPGNTLMDAWCREQRGEPMDRDGAWAASGRVNAPLLAALRADDYFTRPPPKSTGPEHFSLAWLKKRRGVVAEGESRRGSATPPYNTPADVQATLLALTAGTIADGIREAAPKTQEVFVCGGGAHNGALMRALAAQWPEVRVGRTDELGVAGDWVEAMAFAWLARQRLSAAPGNQPATTGASRPAVLGGLWLPE
jgi:anhydro-N-acetylmuramic acid kinase